MDLSRNSFYINEAEKMRRSQLGLYFYYKKKEYTARYYSKKGLKTRMREIVFL